MRSPQLLDERVSSAESIMKAALKDLAVISNPWEYLQRKQRNFVEQRLRVQCDLNAWDGPWEHEIWLASRFVIGPRRSPARIREITGLGVYPDQGPLPWQGSRMFHKNPVKPDNTENKGGEDRIDKKCRQEYSVESLVSRLYATAQQDSDMEQSDQEA